MSSENLNILLNRINSNNENLGISIVENDLEKLVSFAVKSLTFLLKLNPENWKNKELGFTIYGLENVKDYKHYLTIKNLILEFAIKIFKNKSLTNVTINCNLILSENYHIDIDFCDQLSKCFSLKQVVFNIGFNIRNSYYMLLNSIFANPNIESVFISSNDRMYPLKYLEDSSSKQMIKFGENSKLNHLRLTSTKLGDVFIEQLMASLSNKTELTNLFLIDNSLKNDGMKAISNFIMSSNCRLKVLNLKNNIFNNILSVKYFSNALMHNKSLETIYLNECLIQANSAKYLAMGLKLMKTNKLYICLRTNYFKLNGLKQLMLVSKINPDIVVDSKPRFQTLQGEKLFRYFEL